MGGGLHDRIGIPYQTSGRETRSQQSCEPTITGTCEAPLFCSCSVVGGGELFIYKSVVGALDYIDLNRSPILYFITRRRGTASNSHVRNSQLVMQDNPPRNGYDGSSVSMADKGRNTRKPPLLGVSN